MSRVSKLSRLKTKNKYGSTGIQLRRDDTLSKFNTKARSSDFTQVQTISTEKRMLNTRLLLEAGRLEGLGENANKAPSSRKIS